MVIHTYQKDENGYIIPNSDSSLDDIGRINAINKINDALRESAIKEEIQQKRRDIFYRNVAPVIINNCKDIIASKDSSDASKKFAQMTIYMINGFPCD